MIHLKSKNAVLLVGSGALAGVLVTAIAFMVISHPSLETRDFTQTETAERRESFNQGQDTSSSTPNIEYEGSPRSRLSGSMAETLKLDNDFDRTVALYMLLSDANEKFVLDLIDQAKDIKQPTERDEALSIIFSKYAAIDPARALTQAQEFEGYTHTQLIKSIFHQWAKDDLESALAEAKSLKESNRVYADYAARVIIYARDDLSIDRQYALSVELQNHWSMDNLGWRLWRNKARKDPRTAWHDALTATSAISNRELVLTTIAGVWVEKDGIYVLDEINNSTIAEQYKTRIYKDILGQIAQTDPERAIAAATRLKMSPTSRVVAQIFSKWAEKEPYRLFGLADSLDQRFASTAKHKAIQVIAEDSPRQAVDLLREFDKEGLELRAARMIAKTWAKEDPKSALVWYAARELSGHDYTIGSILDRLVSQDVEEAFNIVTAYPGERGRVLTVFLFSTMGRNDVDIMKYFHRLDDDKKLGPALNLGAEIAFSDFNQALGLASTLPDASQKDYLEHIIEMAVYQNRFDLLESIENLPTADLKVFAAMKLLARDKDEALFSNKQIESLRSRLSTEQKENVDSRVMTISIE